MIYFHIGFCFHNLKREQSLTAKLLKKRRMNQYCKIVNIKTRMITLAAMRQMPVELRYTSFGIQSWTVLAFRYKHSIAL